MKHLKFISLMTAALMSCMSFVSCSDDEKDDDPQPDPSNGGTITDADLAKAFFPEGYNKTDVIAWFFCPNVDKGGGSSEKSEALYIFKDYSWVMAGLKSDNGTQTRIIEEVGSATLKSGDLDNGVFSLIHGSTNYDVEIKNGQFTMDKTFTKQPLDKIPTPTKADKDDSGNTQHGTYTDQLTNPYFPTGYENKKIAAWYGFTNVEDTRIKTCTIYLFDDNTAIETEYIHKSHNDYTENSVEITGTYSLDGDYNNGTITLNAETGVGANVGFQTITAKIEKGVLTIGGEPFTKQDNSQVPTATDGKQNNNPNDNPGGETTFSTKATAYLPAEYANTKIAAWYTRNEIKDQSVKIEAVFLFDGNTVVVTNRKVYSDQDGRQPTKEIDTEATYELTSGNYTTGEVCVTLGNGKQMTVTIKDGVLSAMGESYEKQDNNNAPAPDKE